MMRNIPSVATVLASLMLVTGCPDDGTNASGTDTEGADSSSSGGNDEDTNTLTSPDTTVSSTMTDPTTTSPETTADSSSSSAEETGCEGECQTADDCLPGQSCISCLCIGEPTGCEMWGDGAFGDCLNDDGTTDLDACMGGTSPGCVVDNVTTPTAGVCFYPNCTDVCDCPQPPAGFEDQVACEQLTNEDPDIHDCYIDCGGGRDCPTDMFCVGGTFCAFGEPPMGIPPYGDCLNIQGMCEDSICLSDTDMTIGWCAGACTDENDDASCAAAPKGTATPACIDVSGMGDFFCGLDCSDGDCPTGMTCAPAGFCLWEFIPPPEPGYGDCANNDATMACLDDETCLDDASGSVCTATCTMASDCPDAPETGDAPVTCADLGMGDTCYLDCSGGQTCPDNMECLDDNYCHFVALDFILDEDFEGGALPAGWTVIDVDMNTPDMSVDFVDAAWVVTDVVEPGMNNAAYSTSWYAPAGQSDDWLITPQLMAGATSQVRWLGFATDPNYADGYEVRISTTGDQPDDFMIEAVLFSVDNEEQEYTFHSVDISAYSGQMIYLAWRNNSNDDNLLLIDNIQVSD